MKTDKAPEAAQTAIETLTGFVMRHGPGKDTRTFLAMATHLGGGTWATLAGKVYGGRVYDQFTGTHEIIDLWIHPVGGEPHPVRWGHMAIMKPLALLHAPGSAGDAPAIATAAEMAFPDYRKIWRHSFGRAQVFADNSFDTTAPSVAVEGSIFHLPSFARYDAQEDKAIAPAVLAGMDYPARKDAGSPIVDAQGRLAGMMLGPDYGPGSAHAGWYMPIDYILPSLAMATAALPHATGRHSSSIDITSHRTHDVYFDHAA